MRVEYTLKDGAMKVINDVNSIDCDEDNTQVEIWVTRGTGVHLHTLVAKSEVVSLVTHE